MTKTLTCIICPRGCTLTAEIAESGITVTGYSCPRGAAYATDEILHPMRTVTATMRVANRENTMVSVKTENPVPKERMIDVMTALRSTAVKAPIAMGQVLLADVEGTAIVATKRVD